MSTQQGIFYSPIYAKKFFMWLLEVHLFLNDLKHVQIHFLQFVPTIFAKLNISTTLGDT